MTRTEGKRDHGAVWQAFHDRLAPVFRRAGYQPHPAFVAGFDPAHRAYEAVFLGRPAADGLRLIYLTYAPHEPAWQVIGQHFATRDGRALTKELAKRTSDWMQALAALPARRNDLVPNPGWAFWRGTSRVLNFNEKTGKPKALDQAVQSALNAVPEFLEDLGRPGAF